jgi:hypothetical protein
MDDDSGRRDDVLLSEGYCACGCGQRTRIAKQSRCQLGHVKGEPVRFVIGHSTRGRKLALERVREDELRTELPSYGMDWEIDTSSMGG